MEWARTSKNRGLIAAWPQFGGPAGFFIANLAILAFSRLSGAQFLSWGWRVPFWLSLVMVGIGLWIRLGILETPIFQKVIAEERVARAGHRGVQTSAEGGLSHGLCADGTDGSDLHLHRLRFPLRHAGRPRLARRPVGRFADRIVLLVLHGPVFRLVVGPARPQAGLHLWCRSYRALRVRRLRHVRYCDPWADLTGDPDRNPVPRPDVGAVGGADRGMLHPAPALQRRVDRLSARRGVRRRPGADHRDGNTEGHRIGPSDRALHLWLCDRQRRSDSGPTEQQGSGFRAGSPLRSSLGLRDRFDLTERRLREVG